MQDIFKDMTPNYKYLKNTRPIKGLDIGQQTCALCKIFFTSLILLKCCTHCRIAKVKLQLCKNIYCNGCSASNEDTTGLHLQLLTGHETLEQGVGSDAN